VKLLLKHGGAHKDDEGKTPLDVAIREGHLDIASVMEEHATGEQDVKLQEGGSNPPHEVQRENSNFS
jgi:ankyrin repeat protein